MEGDSAKFSPDRMYRYMLMRNFTSDAPLFALDSPAFAKKSLTFVMLNPSTADEILNDPTVARCCRRAKDEGVDRLLVVNAFALRSTDPKALKGHPDPVGPENDEHIAWAAGISTKVVVAWGVNCPLEREAKVLEILRNSHKKMLWCLGITKEGHPRHPLYIRTSQNLVPF